MSSLGRLPDSPRSAETFGEAQSSRAHDEVRHTAYGYGYIAKFPASLVNA